MRFPHKDKLVLTTSAWLLEGPGKKIDTKTELWAGIVSRKQSIEIKM